MTPLLKIDQLQFSYIPQRRLLSGLNWSIEPGEIHCLAGRNGSGKTTLLRLIIGLLQPDDGTILLQGKDVKGQGIDRRAGTIGLALQNPDLQLFAPSIIEEISFGPLNLGWSKDKIENRVEETLRRFHLTELTEENPMLQTFGIRKRIAMASIYAMDPSIYLLDEPDWSLDRKEWLELCRWVREEAESGKAFLIISHNMEWMTGLCSHLFYLKDQGLWDFGRMEDLLLQENPPQGGTDLSRLASRLKNSRALTPQDWVRDYLAENPTGESL